MTTLLLLATLSTPSFAGEAPAPPAFDGVTYMQWSLDLSEDSNNSNAFDVTRAYLGVRQEIGDHLATRLLIDAGRGADDGKLWVFVKNAFVEWKDPAPGMKVQAGMIGTPYIGYAEKFWGHRYAAKSFADEFKLLNSADFGLGATGTHSEGLVDWHVVAINGEGYGKPEVDSTKTFQGRLSLDPLAKGGKMNFTLTGFGSYGTASPDADPDTEGNQEGDAVLQYAGALGFKMDYALIWAEYDGKSVGDVTTAGYSATLMGKVPKTFNVYARYDHIDPATDVDDDATNRVVAGLARDLAKKTSIALQYERSTPEATPDTPSHGIAVKAQAGF